MIQISQIKLPVNHTKTDLDHKIQKCLGLKKVPTYKIKKQSIDARKKQEIKYSYTVELSLANEQRYIKRNKNIMLVKEKKYQIPVSGQEQMTGRPVVVGMGPAGLFAAYLLAQQGYAPIVIERGESVDHRVKTIEQFWKMGILDTESNVQFGEGGAGTFSDGKLNTLVKDKFSRNTYVLETFVKFGAPKEILYTNKPHIGTDLLRTVVKNMREAIISLGGEVHFQTKLTNFAIEQNKIVKLEFNHKTWINCGPVVLAIGHSARDTFEMLYQQQVPMKSKPFAIGVRVEHPRETINESQYGMDYPNEFLPTASYKLTAHAPNGRSVYSFCMCPGGFVVNASSEEGRLVVNGMSNHDRMASNSNSAIIVNVTPEDYGSDHPLAGVEFQRKWEQKAFIEGKGKIPVQLFGDFEKNQISDSFGSFTPSMKGENSFANLNNCLPDYVISAIIHGMHQFDCKIKGFANPDTIISGVESRTSSPIRINRDASFESEIRNLFPCGEGAGYAGGITSAAMDGIKVAEEIIRRYHPANEMGK
ncbi:MAG: FAD-dependent oxidoreductase [Lachnospiraceae bacterium]|nr:FAD-dependent oxidoreductase [Lachnospiraceae bacterium]